MTQGFCAYISSFLVISSPAALYGLSHHSLAVLLPASARRGLQMPSSTADCILAEVYSVCVSLPFQTLFYDLHFMTSPLFTKRIYM